MLRLKFVKQQLKFQNACDRSKIESDIQNESTLHDQHNLKRESDDVSRVTPPLQGYFPCENNKFNDSGGFMRRSL